MTAPVTPRPSATIVVARDGADGPEVLLVRRRAGDAFGDSYAFPGGVVDHDESNAHIACEGLSDDDANAILGVDNGLDYYSAGIRELFEETGILLARDANGDWTTSDSAKSSERQAVDKGELAWPEFLRRRGLCMAGDALHYFSFWETPRIQPKRWQTRFFLAELPPGQSAQHDGREVTDSRWLRPAASVLRGVDQLVDVVAADATQQFRETTFDLVRLARTELHQATCKHFRRRGFTQVAERTEMGLGTVGQ